MQRNGRSEQPYNRNQPANPTIMPAMGRQNASRLGRQAAADARDLGCLHHFWSIPANGCDISNFFSDVTFQPLRHRRATMTTINYPSLDLVSDWIVGVVLPLLGMVVGQS